MFLHPAIIALLGGSLITTAMLIYSSYVGIVIIRRWDISSSSEGQLLLERKTYLLSTIMSFVLALSILSTFLFIYTVDDLHRLFVGAMCATGSLNANPVGWYVLFLKIGIFFLASIWIAMNYIDQRAEDFPLVKKKFVLLLFITPLLITDTYLQFRYFLGLNPNIITSCCGSLFSKEGGGVAAGLSGLPLKPAMIVFYLAVSGFILNALLTLFLQNSAARYLLSVFSVVLFVVAIASIVSFISLYFYEIPTHHCPFDLLQGYYNYIGYPLYFTLFGGTLFGMLTGIFEPFRKIPSLNVLINRVQKKWVILSIFFIVMFAAISSWPIIFSSFTMEGYY
ncbi:hypothetical protein BMS3Bbin06_01856 [bacterium BMS3Bbin06]|nr:hypothetical protein BMS3Abin08_00398 [bacterium BMS3Abin08]GBE35318.1 hypothetical protein BMS3Bbin06_01856 [bacterium BMS3Bbin06]HDY71196.1 hypothetical protein [Nitrospirota bacterium]